VSLEFKLLEYYLEEDWIAGHERLLSEANDRLLHFNWQERREEFGQSYLEAQLMKEQLKDSDLGLIE
jgi:hypothetical protein